MQAGGHKTMATATRLAAETPKYFSLKHVIGFTLLLALLKIGPAAISAVSALLCLWALTGRKQAIQALSLAVIIKHLNQSLYTYPGEFGVIAWLLLILAGLRIFLSASSRQLKLILPLLAFSTLVLLLMTVQDNRYPDVSAMKLFVFSYGAAALLVGYACVQDDEANELATWIFSLMATVVLLSLPTLAFPAIGYTQFKGFHGILSHPQTFGPVLSPLVAWLLGGILFKKNSKLLAPAMATLGLVALIILSEARTAVVAVLLSLASTFIVIFFKRRRFAGFRVGRTLGLALAVVVALAIGMASSSGIRQTLTGFVFKHQTKNLNLDDALSSRSGGVASQWHNFLNKPITGYGFGVYASGEFPSGVVRVMGIPISASVEKGFLPTAILEEVGLPGTLAFLYFIVGVARRVIGNGDPAWIAVFFACLFVNIGEMMFFSLGGIGLYFWLFLGLSTRMGKPGEAAATISDRFAASTSADLSRHPAQPLGIGRYAREHACLAGGPPMRRRRPTLEA